MLCRDWHSFLSPLLPPCFLNRTISHLQHDMWWWFPATDSVGKVFFLSNTKNINKKNLGKLI